MHNSLSGKYVSILGLPLAVTTVIIRRTYSTALCQKRRDDEITGQTTIFQGNTRGTRAGTGHRNGSKMQDKWYHIGQRYGWIAVTISPALKIRSGGQNTRTPFNRRTGLLSRQKRRVTVRVDTGAVHYTLLITALLSTSSF